MVKCEILEEGQQALFYRYDGKVTLKKGPKRIWLFLSKLKFLDVYSAQHDEFLKIKYNDGRLENRIGPCQEVLNTLLYSSISVEKCYCLDANQSIIVYYKVNDKSDKYERKIIYGPGIFMIEPDEWVHKFSWSGNYEQHKTKYLPNKDNFEVLNMAPSQLYYNIDQVRTSDDALIEIKLMVFYELKDIDKMMNETKDPIGDILNCCNCDVISFITNKTYLNFIETCHELNNLDKYDKLIERAKIIGFEITKVVFRGYLTSPILQQMHDSSMEKRTELKLDFESEQQLQDQLNLKLINEMNRLRSEQDLEFKNIVNQQNLEKLKHENEYNMKVEENKKKIELDKQLKIKVIENKQKENELKLKHLERLKQLEVDLNQYLLSNIEKPDKIVKIVSDNVNLENTNQKAANIHFHE